MANTLKFGAGEWATKKGSTLAYNSENGNFKPLPFTFDRSTSATRVNKQGLIEVVPNNEPRIDFSNDSKGALLLEPSRTNYDSESLNFTTSFMSNSSGIQSSSLTSKIAPDGSNDSVYKITKATDNSDPYLGRSGVSFTGTKMVFSVWLWTDENQSKDVLFLVYRDSTQEVQTKNITLTTTPTRYFIEATFTTTPSNVAYRIDLDEVSSNQYIYAWGKQLEQGSYATSYIPTQGSIGTRVAESCLKDDINTSIINSSYPFSMYAESTYVGGNKHVLSFYKKSVSDNFYVISINDNNEVLFQARANGATELIQSGVTLVDGQKFKVAITMESATSGKICVNGNTVVSKTNFSNQAVNNQINDLLLGQLRTVTDTGNRLPITDARLYNTALTDQELINLTTI